MTERTWMERGEWMHKHLLSISGTNGGMVNWQAFSGEPHRETGRQYLSDAIDAAMDECERLEKEAAEQQQRATKRVKFCAECHGDPEYGEWKKVVCDVCQGVIGKDIAQDRERSPMSALLNRWQEAIIAMEARRQLREAIAAQAALWRKEADNVPTIGPDRFAHGSFYAQREVLRHCADELEGK